MLIFWTMIATSPRTILIKKRKSRPNYIIYIIREKFEKYNFGTKNYNIKKYNFHFFMSVYMRYADHKKTLDKYGGPKETISIWAPSHTPHIPKIARNWNSLLPETTLSKNLMSTPKSEIKIFCNISSQLLQTNYQMMM